MKMNAILEAAELLPIETEDQSNNEEFLSRTLFQQSSLFHKTNVPPSIKIVAKKRQQRLTNLMKIFRKKY